MIRSSPATSDTPVHGESPAPGLLDRIIAPWSAVMMFVMALITVVDVIGRYVFSMPLRGGFEITEILLALIIFAGLPIVSRDNTHITVDLLTSRLTASVRRRQQLTCDVVVALLCLGLAWAMAHKALDLIDQKETTPYLNLPVAPVAAFMSVSCLITALLVLLRVWSALVTREDVTAADASRQP